MADHLIVYRESATGLSSAAPVGKEDGVYAGLVAIEQGHGASAPQAD